MRQKVVIKLYINGNDQKSRTKAFKIAVSQPGVISAVMQGGGLENYKLEVVGDYIDAVILTNCLKKKLGQAQLVSVGPVAAATFSNNNNEWPHAFSAVADHQPPQLNIYRGIPQYQVYEDTGPNPECCSIM
ncbi:disease resistance protein Pik-1-like [Solanum stenotomum]|uniref:disease resistance protein Pik-1-like n=1 Tax=Solanum stenotomum TaxID=172797 RepID=UPI0020D15320|nr:disease resistance protein Pik-1-like [Solanum stenotomum]